MGAHRIVTKIIFPVIDLADGISFYEALGFSAESWDQTYAWIKYNGEEVLHLRLVADLDPGSNHASGYFHVQDPDKWHARCVGGGGLLTPVEDKPWQMREFSLTDPSGNLLRFGSNR